MCLAVKMFNDMNKPNRVDSNCVCIPVICTEIANDTLLKGCIQHVQVSQLQQLKVTFPAKLSSSISCYTQLKKDVTIIVVCQ